MVAVTKLSARGDGGSSSRSKILCIGVSLLCILLMFVVVFNLQDPVADTSISSTITTTTTASSSLEAQRLRNKPAAASAASSSSSKLKPLPHQAPLLVHAPPNMVHDTLEEAAAPLPPPLLPPHNANADCPYTSFHDLTDDEWHPKQGDRHMMTPPQGGPLTLVCCQTTKGPMNILAHHKWAPLGAKRFVQMVTKGYFQTGVPLMRCIDKFLCQFGLNADPAKRKDFSSSIPDDPFWLPTGPTGRQNSDHVKRFAQGYLAYAGAGPQTRSNQLIVALQANGPLAGGSPWEVPWGELVGKHSFDTLSRIYTGYGEKGPPQGRLGREGFTEQAREEWPLLDHILSCRVVQEEEEPGGEEE
jgi:peptidyl-prolyl cis-trans isomerase A (cyclophilin A)